MAINFKSNLDLSPYAMGNAVPGGLSPVTGVAGEMARRVVGMVNAMPPEIAARFRIISGYRSAERQAEVNPSVKNSRHTHGMALDLDKDPVVLKWINDHPEHGLGFPLQSDPKEKNHLEMVDRGLRAPITGGPPPFKPMAIPSPTSDVPETPVPTTPVPSPADAVASLPAAGAKAAQGASDFAALADKYRALAAYQSLHGPGSLSDAVANLVQQAQAPAAKPEPILQPVADLGGPIPISRRLR